jgi:regulator of protease activity HflC (stomatin/prohibitin superfamily)
MKLNLTHDSNDSNSGGDINIPWKRITLIGGAVVVVTLMSGFVGCKRVEPGHVGIKVNYYGTDRGVQSFPIVTGMVWYNPIAETVFEYPTYVQTAVWTRNPHEGGPQNEEISFNTKEGLVITADISLSYQISQEKIPAFYVKFRSDDLERFTHGFMRNVARDAFNEEAANYTAEEVYASRKEEFLNHVRDRINRTVSPYGPQLEQMGFIGAPRLPQNVVDALNSKIQATQIAQRVENELRAAEAEAKKRIAAAEGEARANRVLSESLNDKLLQWRQLELQGQALGRWNGQLPQYTGGSQPIPFIQVK